MNLEYFNFRQKLSKDSISNKKISHELNFQIINDTSNYNRIKQQQAIFKNVLEYLYRNMITENLVTKSILQMRNNFIMKNNNSYPLSLKCMSEGRNMKIKIKSGSYGERLNQTEKFQNDDSQKQQNQISDDSFPKGQSFYVNKKGKCSNTNDLIERLIKYQYYKGYFMISKQISIKLFINNKLIEKRVTLIKNGCDEEKEISDEQTKNLLDFINTKIKRLSKLQANKQINIFFKYPLSQNKNQLLGGGGCCSSKPEISEMNFNPIKITDETQINSNLQNKEFELSQQNLEYFEKVNQSIKNDDQLKLQSYLLKKYILDDLIQYEEKVNTHKSEIQDIFEAYVILEMTRVSNKSEKKQEELDNLLQELKSIKAYEQDYPIQELVFLSEMLSDLNNINHKFDQSQQKEIIKIKELVQRILIFHKNKEIFSEIASSANSIKQNIHLFEKTKQLFPLQYQIEIWLKKIDQFKDKFISLDISSEILFYVNIFEIYKSQKQQDLIILTLIRINYLLEKFQKYKSNLDDRIQIYQQFSNNLIKENINEFLSDLMQKSDLFENKLFLVFSIENQNYRYITLSILININSIFTLTSQNTQNQEYLFDFLCNKYLTEQELSIRVLFEKTTQFVQNFNKNIKSEEFKQRILNFDKQRKLKLLPYFKSLDDHERSINSFDDIIKLISDNAIQKWERDIKKRQRQNLAQKDDVLLEVKDLYINQKITYQKGNNIFQNKTEDKFSASDLNALQDILNLFLNPNYSYRLKYLNNSRENENEQKFLDQSNKCQILGILAEGGTGKSMLMKKIETFLIEKLSKLNTQTETGNYLPLLIKCNQLDSENPSIDDYLKKQGGINEDQLQNLKQNKRNKLILLDGYDEYTGDYFVVYKKLNLNQWKNTKVIVATRKEKLSEEEASLYFSQQNESGQRDEMSYSLVKLKEFTTKDIHEYAERYFKQERKTDEINIIEKDLKNLRECLTNLDLEKLLHLPINLYLFTRMLVNLSDKDIQNLKSKVSDQIGIQEIFFSDQFEREAQSYIDAHVHSTDLKKDQEFRKSLKNCYFEYFQTIAMIMFNNRGVKSNFLQVEKQNINFKIQQSVIHDQLDKNLVNSLLDKIKNYINSKIVTRAKEEVNINEENEEQSIKHLIEFRHKSLFEYFAARAMKYDFDVHGESIFKLTIEQLKEFKINQKSIMNAGQNQSEQQILLKLYKMIKNEIESNQYYSTYYLQDIEKNSRYIQYIKKSTIKRNTETSQIDIGASNILSALFVSNFAYSNLELNSCSFSKLYVSRQKSDLINLDNCNLQNSYLKNLNINYDSCNTQFATFDAFQKVFDTQNIFSFNQVVWDKNNMLYSITQSGYINAFKIENQNIQLQKSKQLSQSSLIQMVVMNTDTLLVSSQYSLFLMNSNNFELLESYKFKNEISCFSLIKENILVISKNGVIFHGSFKLGFKKINITGSGCVYSEFKKILLIYSGGNISLYEVEKNFKLIKTIQGHDNSINSVNFSADGKYLATASNQTCKIWNAEKDFELINTIQGHQQWIMSIAFSVDGKYLTTGSHDNTCKIWNAQKDFELINTILGHNNCINTVAFSADGKYLATGSVDNICKIWSAENGFKIINTIQDHSNTIFSVAFSADGKYMATASQDSTCKIWNAEKGFKLINTIQGHTDAIFSIAFSVDGKFLATGSRDMTCKIWNAEKSFELFNTIQSQSSQIRSVGFSSDGKYLATGSEDKTCNIWSIEKGYKLVYTVQSHTSCINSLSFSSDGKYLATGSKDKTCKIWNAEKGFELINTIQGHRYSVDSVTFSAGGKYLTTGSSDNTCKIWNAYKDFELIYTIQDHTDTIYSVAFSVDGKYLATGSKDQTCKMWNVEKSFELINTIQDHTDTIFSIAFSVDGKYLATGSKDKTCKIWNQEQGFEIINEVEGHINFIVSVAFSTDGKYLATGSEDKTCKIWNTEKGFELAYTITGHTSQILSVSFSEDGKYLATGSFDNTCIIWNVEKGFEFIRTIQDHTDNVNSVAFSANGKYLATGSNDKTCKIWNTEKDFELISTIQEHTDGIFSVAFSIDGKYLATGSSDHTCKIWNVMNVFDIITTIQGHNGTIFSVTFSPDGKYIATGSEDNNCKIWNVEKNFELINIIECRTGAIFSVAFSIDGEYILTGLLDNTCKIWNVKKGFKLINILQCHTSRVFSVTFSADGQYLATGSSDNTCKIWNAEKSFGLINTISGQTLDINTVVCSTDRKCIKVEYNDKSYEIYNLQEYKIMSEQNKQDQLQEQQFEQIESNNLEKLRIFENIYIL